MIKSGHVSRRSIIRGPSTNGFWMPAGRVPGIAQLLGVCHACGESVHPKQGVCAACRSPLLIHPEAIPMEAFEPRGSATDHPDPTAPGSAVDLVSQAQYRRIERLQNTVRIQLIALAVSISLLAALLVLFLMPGLRGETGSPDTRSLAAVPSTTGVGSEAASSPRTGPEDSPPELVPEVESIPLLESPESSDSSGVIAPRVMEDAPAASDPVPANDAGQGALEEVLEIMRDVTPAQRRLLQALRVQLDRAEDEGQSIGARLEAVTAARALIDGFPLVETDEFFRARLAVLRGEFGKIEAEILDGSTAKP